jgi:hypothetical protein
MAHSALFSDAVVENTPGDTNGSGVSWGAVIAGAFVVAALSLALLALGTGIGFSSVSPWPNAGASASAIGVAAIVWLVLMQLIASFAGGYLAGRLRTKWVGIHTHEVYFRDTAHGFLVWAVGLVIAAAFLASAALSAGGTARTNSATAETSGAAQSPATANRYFTDELLRTTTPAPAQDDASVREEIGLIFANGLREGGLPPADKSYLAQLVAQRTGISEPDAEKRVDDVFAQDRQAADKVRKSIAHAMYWTFLALLIGAFSASLAATIGGKQRDRVVVI